MSISKHQTESRKGEQAMQINLSKEAVQRIIEALALAYEENSNSKILRHSPLTSEYKELRDMFAEQIEAK